MSNNPNSDMGSLEGMSFIKSLYDFKFESFVAMKVLRLVYKLIVILYSLGAVAYLLIALATGKPLLIILGIILIPLGYIIYLALARVSFELMMVVFRIGSDVHEIASRGRNSTEQ